MVVLAAVGPSAPPPTGGDGDWAQLKRTAIMRGLDFLLTMGETLFRNEQLAARHGPDIMLPFYIPAATSAATVEERHALHVATRLAGHWRSRTVRVNQYMPLRMAPAELLNLMQGLYSLDGLGMGDPALKAQVAERTAAWGAADFLKYDPASGVPPASVRETCSCGMRVEAGAAECPGCRRPAVPMSQFDVWLEALVWSFHGCRMRIGLGACFFDVLRQVHAQTRSTGDLWPAA